MTLISGPEPMDRIGGEFGLTADDFLKPETNANLNHPRKRHRLFLDTGRSAIYTALLSIIGQGGRKEAWLPRYCCPSVFLPFRRLGFRLSFYSPGNDLNSPSDLPDRQIGRASCRERV
jgi:hypothetical protein